MGSSTVNTYDYAVLIDRRTRAPLGNSCFVKVSVCYVRKTKIHDSDNDEWISLAAEIKKRRELTK